MRAYSLVELGDSEEINLFLREEDARRALADALRDEPDWAAVLYVEPVELLDGRRWELFRDRHFKRRAVTVERRLQMLAELRRGSVRIRNENNEKLIVQFVPLRPVRTEASVSAENK